VDVSPAKFPVIVNAMVTERSASKVADRLFAKALVLDDGQTGVALCVVDTCMMPRDLIERIFHMFFALGDGLLINTPLQWGGC
jgi:hypothetical protein